MSLDCLLIGSNLGSYRMAQRSRWMGAQRETPADLPADTTYLNTMTEEINLGESWLEVFDLVNHLVTRHGGSSIYDLSAEVANHACVLLSAYLRRRGVTTKWVNSFDHQRDELARILMTDNPLVTCITTTLLVHPGPIMDMVAFVRMHNPT